MYDHMGKTVHQKKTLSQEDMPTEPRFCTVLAFYNRHKMVTKWVHEAIK